MNHFAHSLDDTIQTLQPILIFIALLGWGIAFVGVVSARRSRSKGMPKAGRATFILGAAIFGSVISGEFAFAALMKHAAWEEIRPRLSSSIDRVTVNSARAADQNAIIVALKNIHDAAAHHSHPTTEYRVLLDTSQGPLYLRLCRDSDNPHEYWVFYPGFRSTDLSEIGRTFTDVLDGQ
jgi:hypothetical protein